MSRFNLLRKSLSTMEPYTEKNRKQAENIVPYDVKHEGSEFRFMQIHHALICESGESCKRPTKPSRHQQSPTIMFMVGGPSENVAHDDAANYVYD